VARRAAPGARPLARPAFSELLARPRWGLLVWWWAEHPLALASLSVNTNHYQHQDAVHAGLPAVVASGGCVALTPLDGAVCGAQVEVLVEMGANSQERRGRVNKYTPLAVLEALKCAPAPPRSVLTPCAAGGRSSAQQCRLTVSEPLCCWRRSSARQRRLAVAAMPLPNPAAIADAAAVAGLLCCSA